MQEARLHGPKMAAVAAFARANQLDRFVIDGKPARLGVITTGKAYLDAAAGRRWPISASAMRLPKRWACASTRSR